MGENDDLTLKEAIAPEACVEEVVSFDEDLIKKYPRSNRRVNLNVSTFSLGTSGPNEGGAHTIHISPHGMQFRCAENYAEGTLLKIQISIPDYWARKQRLVDYSRIDTPERFKVLAKVVKTEDVGKRGKRRMVMVRTVNMDDVDEQVLKIFLQDG